jgi:hypothetical protein
MKKNIIRVAVLAVGVVLLLATETESGISNIVGLSMVGYELDKLGLFYK